MSGDGAFDLRALRAELEDFLYLEAQLLDEWRLREWLELLTPDAEYEVPAIGPAPSDPRTQLALIYDDRERIDARVKQYEQGLVLAENPPSVLRRMISNVRVLSATEDTAQVTANFVVYRSTPYRTDTFVGHLEHSLVGRRGAWKIRKRRVVLDMQTLHQQCMLSILV